MEEIILKIQELKSIKPEKKWVNAVKSQIMGKERWLELFDFGFEPNFDWLRSKTIWLGAGSFAIFVFAVFAYNQLYLYSQMAVNTKALETISENLRTVQSEIVRTKDGLGRIEVPEQALGVKDTIGSAIENGGKLVAGTKKISDNPGVMMVFPKIFSTLNGLGEAADGVNSALQDMEETYLSKQKELAKGLIEDLEKKQLTDEQKTLLEEAKNLYNEGKYDLSLEKVLNITK